MPSVKSLTKVKHEPGKRGIRRVAMLNKMFMKSITDIMSTGTVSMDIVGRGIEISKVHTTPDFQTLKVFWVCKGDSTDEETGAVLNKIAGALRHELSTLRVMGEIPYIVFVKDKQEALVVDLDRRLATADYGEDYSPIDFGHLLKTEFTSHTKLSPEMKAKIKQLEDDLPLEEDPIPDMTNDVYGLDHAKVMNRLMAARKKSKDAWSNLNSDPDVISYRSPVDKLPEVDIGDQKQELADFLLQRKILQNKLHKQLRDMRQEWQGIADDDGDEQHDDESEYYVDDDDDYYYDDRLEQEDKDTRTPS